MPTAPVLDHEALHRLGEELREPQIFCGFLHRYIALLDQRLARLDHALSAADHDGWMDAVLSLKTSSAQAGAHALADHAAELQQDAAPCPSWSVTPCTAALYRTGRMASLRATAAETTRQLRLFLQQFCGAARAS